MNSSRFFVGHSQEGNRVNPNTLISLEHRIGRFNEQIRSISMMGDAMNLAARFTLLVARELATRYQQARFIVMLVLASIAQNLQEQPGNHHSRGSGW